MQYHRSEALPWVQFAIIVMGILVGVVSSLITLNGWPFIGMVLALFVTWRLRPDKFREIVNDVVPHRHTKEDS